MNNDKSYTSFLGDANMLFLCQCETHCSPSSSTHMYTNACTHTDTRTRAHTHRTQCSHLCRTVAVTPGRSGVQHTLQMVRLMLGPLPGQETGGQNTTSTPDMGCELTGIQQAVGEEELKLRVCRNTHSLRTSFFATVFMVWM